MSGNRTLHREQIHGSDSLLNQQGPEAAAENLETDAETLAIWSLACTNEIIASSKTSMNLDKDKWFIWATGSEGGHSIQGYQVSETSLEEKQSQLEASALRLRLTHHCFDDGGTTPAHETSSTANSTLGGSCVSTIRNYTGEDRNAGDRLMLSLDLSNVLRIWNLSSNETSVSNHIQQHKVHTRFYVEKATGTTAAFLPPRLALIGDPKSWLENVVAVAIGCLDGTIALVSTGIPIFNPHHQNKGSNNQKGGGKIPPAGTVVETLGSPTGGGSGGLSFSDIPLCIEWNPVTPQTIAAGHGNGVVHLYSNKLAAEGGTTTKHYRLNHLGESPVRALAFTSDGNLLVAGNDQGRLCVWDCSCQFKQQQQQPPALVNHLAQAHSSWILRIVAIDSRRFCSLGADKSISVWNVGQFQQPMHTFQSNQPLWSMALCLGDTINSGTNKLQAQQQAPRLVAGSSNGWLEVYSLESMS
ncbi:hypothetical protein ACA910_009253 [Epithemia clementina (nom. ined.)]